MGREKIAKDRNRDVAGKNNRRTRLDRYHLSICANDVMLFIQLLFMIVIFVVNTGMLIKLPLSHIDRITLETSLYVVKGIEANLCAQCSNFPERVLVYIFQKILFNKNLRTKKDPQLEKKSKQIQIIFQKIV